MGELKLIEIQWNVKDYAVDFLIPSKYDHIVLEHKDEIIDKLEFLTKALKERTYPFGNIKGLGHMPEKKTLLTVDVKASDFEEVKNTIKNQQILIESQSRVLERFISGIEELKARLNEVRENVKTAKDTVVLEDHDDSLVSAISELNYLIDFFLEEFEEGRKQ